MLKYLLASQKVDTRYNFAFGKQKTSQMQR